jgi:uncharacterized FAD-dependent dehydrogenase
MRIQMTGLSLELGEGEEQLARKASALLKLAEMSWSVFRVIRKSLDARRNRPPRFVYTVEIDLPDHANIFLGTVQGVTIVEAPPPLFSCECIRKESPGLRPVVVGSGPAGLFAALTLALQGIPVLLLERGGDVGSRVKDVNRFWESGILNRESNVQFGEGGAGTFSDGKLTSRVKNPLAGWVKEIFVEMGAPGDILTDAKPHIGTDNLRNIVVNLRRKLTDLGCELRFQSRLSGIQLHHGRLDGVVVNDVEEIKTHHLILAPGQSADDTYTMLSRSGVVLEPKPFAIGLRVEHPQEWMNRIQYGPWWTDPQLPPADYVLTAQVSSLDRGVYSFCMCPGGRVIGCSVDEGGIITNGMSYARRDAPYANSAVVVTVRTEDFVTSGGNPLAGLVFRRHWEEKAFALGGGGYHAPAQGLDDFIADREGDLPRETSFQPGIRPVLLREALPVFVSAALKEGFGIFERKMPGFICKEAVLIGVETRTSSPIRIKRGEDGQCSGIAGIYPCGEGAGYAGGIISSALDGIGAAKRLLESVR